jgi:hypothetical protein
MSVGFAADGVTVASGVPTLEESAWAILAICCASCAEIEAAFSLSERATDLAEAISAARAALAAATITGLLSGVDCTAGISAFAAGCSDDSGLDSVAYAKAGFLTAATSAAATAAGFPGPPRNAPTAFLQHNESQTQAMRANSGGKKQETNSQLCSHWLMIFLASDPGEGGRPKAAVFLRAISEQLFSIPSHMLSNCIIESRQTRKKTCKCTRATPSNDKDDASGGCQTASAEKVNGLGKETHRKNGEGFSDLNAELLNSELEGSNYGADGDQDDAALDLCVDAYKCQSQHHGDLATGQKQGPCAATVSM